MLGGPSRASGITLTTASGRLLFDRQCGSALCWGLMGGITSHNCSRIVAICWHKTKCNHWELRAFEVSEGNKH